MSKKLLGLLFGALILAPLATPKPAHAIAAFARQYNTECSTCHDPYPHRTEFGEAFRKNGYIWPGHAQKAPEAQPAADAQPAAESHSLLNQIPEAFGIAGIIKDVPVSFSGIYRYSYDTEREKDHIQPTNDFQIHLGGNIGGEIGFFAHNIKSSAESTVQAKNILGLPFDIRFGNLIPQTTLNKPNQNLTSSVPATLSLQVSGEPSLETPRDAAELQSIFFDRLFFVAGAGDRPNQNSFDYYGHLSLKLGGSDMHGNAPDVNFDEESIWDFLTITLGGFGYAGKTEATEDNFYKIGFDTELRYKKLLLLGSVMQAKNDSVGVSKMEVKSLVYAAEVDYFVDTKHTFALRYEASHAGNDDENGIIRTVTGALNYTPMQSFLLRFEGRWRHTEDEKDPVDTTGLLTAQLHI